MATRRTDAASKISVVNAKFPIHARKTANQQGERLLHMIGGACSQLIVETQAEINLPAGPIGVFGNRRFQRQPPPLVGAPPGAALPPPERDVAAIVVHFTHPWKALLKSLSRMA